MILFSSNLALFTFPRLIFKQLLQFCFELSHFFPRCNDFVLWVGLWWQVYAFNGQKVIRMVEQSRWCVDGFDALTSRLKVLDDWVSVWVLELKHIFVASVRQLRYSQLKSIRTFTLLPLLILLSFHFVFHLSVFSLLSLNTFGFLLVWVLQLLLVLEGKGFWLKHALLCLFTSRAWLKSFVLNDGVALTTFFFGCLKLGRR